MNFWGLKKIYSFKTEPDQLIEMFKTVKIPMA